jgi:transcriptional regulator with XRE-family HTH domain
MSFGKKLLALRIKHNLNQNKMSERLNISQPVYSRYENDEKEVTESDDFVKRVAEEFDVTRKWLLSKEDNAVFESFVSNNNSPLENYYNLPKDFMDVYFRQQQQMLEKILNVLGKSNLLIPVRCLKNLLVFLKLKKDYTFFLPQSL